MERNLTRLENVKLFIPERFAIPVLCELKGIRDCRNAIHDTGNDVGAAGPVRLFQVSLRPSSGMLGVGMVETHDVLRLLANLALDTNELPRIDEVAIVRRIGTLVLAAH